MSASVRSSWNAPGSGARASRRRPSTPPGPWLATPDELGDILALGMWLDVNGRRRQTGSTATMIFDPYFIVHYLSQFMVLEPGDLINTGTPPGVGMGCDPPVWLQPGDVMELGIDGLGSQRQTRGRAPVTSPVEGVVLTGPKESEVRDLPDPVPEAGQVVVDVARVGHLRNRRRVLHR